MLSEVKCTVNLNFVFMATISGQRCRSGDTSLGMMP